MRNDLEERLRELGQLVDGWTREALAATVSPPAERFGAMLEYHLGWRGEDLQPLDVPVPAGKKLRPALTLLVSEAVCGSIEPARNAAVAVELIHNFSLVHDDIQDRSALRRHRRTLWSLWGAAQGINAGDALFSLAQIVLLEQPGDTSARMAAELNRTALRLAEGQYLDIELQVGGTPSTLATYEAMIARKTGALFSCACRLGALAASAAPEVQASYASFGLELGLAFQEQDDLLGVWGQAAETGKPEAADIVERKRGLPAALALGQPDAPAWLTAVYAEQDDPVPPETVERVIAHFAALDIQARIETRVEQRYQRALESLAAANPRPPASDYLAGACASLVARRA